MNWVCCSDFVVFLNQSAEGKANWTIEKTTRTADKNSRTELNNIGIEFFDV